jgi:hypothetical protein
MPRATGIVYHLITGPKDGSKRRQPYMRLTNGLEDVQKEAEEALL